MLVWLRKHKNLVEWLAITRLEQVFVSDITYVFTYEGYNYLSLVTDAYSMQVMGKHQRLARDLKAAVRIAVKNRTYSHPLIHHLDRGLQYCFHDY